jgi:hypothetical protein
MALRIKGTTSPRCTRYKVYKTLVQRHESLRTAFPTVHGAPTIQLSLVVISYQLSLIYLIYHCQQDNEVQNFVDEDAQRSF